MQKLYFIFFLILFFSCGEKENSNKQKPCLELITDFKFPEDLHRMQIERYVCSTKPVSIQEKLKSYDIELNLVFNDKNYSLFEQSEYSVLFFDKRNDLKMFFTCYYPENFSKSNINQIFFLDKDNLLPLYICDENIETKETIIYKLFYDDKHDRLYSYIIKMKNRESINLNQLSYDDIVEIYHDLEKDKYSLTNKFNTWASSKFKKIPYWLYCD